VPSNMRTGTALDAAKRGLVRLGAHLPVRAHYELNAATDYLHLGRWMRDRGHAPPKFRDRDALFKHVGDRISAERVLYLEFGVAEGGSIRAWSGLLRNPQTELHGFDSFEGLPADWIMSRPAGHFGRGGEPPEVDDQRVRFHPGWFEDSLPRFEWPSGWERMVANFDADLYSSTYEALAFVEPHVQPGTIMYFDEFNHRAHELKAFEEFLSRTGTKVRAIGATRALSHVAFETL
jgi:hypothetical protein